MKLLLSAIFAGLLVGCAKHPGNLVFEDSSGRIIASGNIELPKTLPTPGSSFEGSWAVNTAEENFPRTAKSKGRYVGTVTGNGVSITFDPNMSDNYLMLEGRPGDDRMRGTWTHATLGKPETGGRFRYVKNRDDTPLLTQAD